MLRKRKGDGTQEKQKQDAKKEERRDIENQKKEKRESFLEKEV